MKVELLEKKRVDWKKNRWSGDFHLDQMNAENESLKEEVFLKTKLNDQLKVQLDEAERRTEKYEMKAKGNLVHMKSIEEKLSGSESERKGIENENERLTLLVYVVKTENKKMKWMTPFIIPGKYLQI